MSLFWKSFLWALGACLISMGTVITPFYTVSSRVSAPEISRMDECLLGGEDWECVGAHSATTAIDPGAISWQEIPTHLYFNKYKFESKPLWNPFIGSGYPVFLDGIFRPLSLIRQWLVFSPSDQGRDIAVFFRFLIWTWGIIYSVALLGVTGRYLFFIGLAATTLPYMQKYLDIIFLDTEMAVPWAFALYLSLGKVDFRKSAFGFAILGFWVGTQSFIQSQITFILALGALSLIYFLNNKKSLSSFLIFLISFALFGSYNIFEFKSYFSELISNRSFVGCVSTHGLSWLDVWMNSYVGLTKRAEMNTLFAITAVPFVIYGLVRKKEIRILSALYLALFVWIIFGLPQIVCNVVGLNAIHFWRHLVPYMQSLFLIVSAASLYLFIDKFKRRKVFLSLGFIVAILPASNRTLISVEHLRSKFPKEETFEYSKIPAQSIYSRVQQLSQLNDRRHFSPDYRLYPNYSAAFEILDMRVLYGSYPKRIFALNDGLFSDWHEMPFYKHADRFVSVDNPNLKFPSVDFEKLMLLHRVSLITFSKSQDYIKGAAIYNQKNCHFEKEDQLAVLYLCPFVGGVGYFPKKVALVDNLEEGVDILKKMDIKDILDFAVVENKKNEAKGAQGEILSVFRVKDKTVYKLKVTQEGYFVYSDTYFPGWHAYINGNKVEIFPANVGFKSVWLPLGEITLEWHFTKNRE